MRNIKHSFYLMVGVSFLLLMVFNKFLLKSHNQRNDKGKEEHEKMFLISDEVDTTQQHTIQTVDEDKPVVVTILDNLERSGNFIEDIEQKTESQSYIIKDTIPVYSSKQSYSQEELDALNEKIEADPLLIRLRQNFKSLKQAYNDLGQKFQKLSKENKQLMKKKGTANKKQQGELTSIKSQDVKNVNTPQTTAATKKKIEELTRRDQQRQMVLRYSNPFYLLGGYPNITLEYFNSYPDGRPYYERFNFGLHNDLDYCELVDAYNLAHPENMFKRMTFFTDYGKNEILPRRDVMRKIGYDLSPKISKFMPRRIFRSRTMHLDPRITTFFTKRVDLHIYHEIGKHFLCATQMYNHIPGHGVLKRKDMIVDSVDAYALRYKEKSSCFNKHKFFPFSYRLYIKEECDAFFNKINSQEYKDSLKEEPIQYLIKIGYGSHRAQGVFLLDQKKTASVKETYYHGKLCGIETKSIIAQTYITNPLLLDLQNKFDFRVYMLIASTNPLIVFYHDGFLRVSLFPYDKNSNDRSTHLTNTHLAKDTFHDMQSQNKTLHGMSEKELRNYQMWTLDRLQEYLLSSGKITDKKWLDNYLRPKFKEAFIHIVRMSGGAFWNQSNVFELFGLDFMLDSDLNLWFIECNSSPQFIGTNKYKANFLTKMIKDMFEIQYAYYRSRMKRFFLLIKEMENESTSSGGIDYAQWKQDYANAAKNKLEHEYQLSKDNSFVMIMDKNLKGSKAYFGNLKKECVDD